MQTATTATFGWPPAVAALLVGDKLVVAYTEQDWDETGNRLTRNQPFIALIDPAEPSDPQLVAQIALLTRSHTAG